jgi:hypothetical protein
MSFDSGNHHTNEQSALPGDATLTKVAVLSFVVLICLALSPFVLKAQENLLSPRESHATPEVNLSGGNGDQTVQPSGGNGDQAVQPSGGEEELPAGSAGIFDLGPSLSSGDETTEEAPVDRSAGETETALPQIELLEGEPYEKSPSEAEGVIGLRPKSEYYDEVVKDAPKPDISLLGPIPEKLDKGVEFSDVAADWIYYQKSTGMTELKGHVMIIYDTTIISSDEAVLDEKNKIYHFFGEGRVFVDDSDFTLDCDDLEIHDAETEKMILIKGASTMVVFADKEAVKPTKTATNRAKLEYALKQQDTTITFTDAEYNYDKHIFDAHGGVRFEQSDKYASGGDFHGEDERDYMLFKDKCEFWQKDGKWLYTYDIVKDKESPPSRGDKIKRALLSVPTTITCLEAEAEGEDGWLELRNAPGDVVYFKQDDKHAECDKFTIWYTEEEETQAEIIEPQTGPQNLLVEKEEAKTEEKPKYVRPPGFGTLYPESTYSAEFIPWEANPIPRWSSEGTGTAQDYSLSTGQPEGLDSSVNYQVSSAEPDVFNTSTGIMNEVTEPGGLLDEMRAESGVESSTQNSKVPHNEMLMQGNVFARQENGDWLFTYDIVNEKDEDEDTVKQYRKWANASTDLLHVWMDDNKVEAIGSVKGEQDNQNGAADFVRYIGDFDMAYIRGNILINREGKHSVSSGEGFLFFSTKVFQALGNVVTKLMVDVQKEQDKRRNQGSGNTPTEGGSSGGGAAPSGGG